MKNIAFALKSLRRYDSALLPLVTALALLNVAVPLAGIFLPKVTLQLLADNAPARQIIITVGVYTLVLAALHFFRDFSQRNRRWRNNHISQGLSHDIILKTLDCEYSYLEDPEKQSLCARLRQDADNPNGNCGSKTLDSLGGLVTGILGLILYSFILSGLNLWIILLLALTALANYFALKYAREYEHKNKGKWAPLDRKIAYVLGMTGNYEYGKDIRLYNMSDWFLGMAKRLFGERSDWDKRVKNRTFFSEAVNALTVLLRDGVAYALLIYKVTQGEVTIANFMLFFGAISGFSVFVTSIVENASSLSSALLYVNDVRDYISGGCVRDPETPAELPSLSTPLSVEFQSVTFAYGDGEKVLDNFNLSIRAGEKIALVGVNGAGKTTIVKLLCGFFQPQEGRVLINGTDINRYRRQDLFLLFSVVFQDEFIMPFTVAENFTDGSEDGIRRSLEEAGLWGVINAHPKGVHAPISKVAHEDGMIFSGGERQKFLLARALHKDAPILVLDEPTAALDPIAENEIYQKYHSLSGGRTSIFISHRLASTRFCDRIVLLGDGGILETGSHDALMASGGEYAKMYEIQSHYYRKEAAKDGEE